MASGSRLWPLGVSITLPAGVLGAAMVVFGWFAPELLSGSTSLAMLSMVLVAALIFGLILIFSGAKMTSRRFRQPQVVAAVLLSVLVLIGLAVTHLRARHLYPPQPLAPPDIDLPD